MVDSSRLYHAGKGNSRVQRFCRTSHLSAYIPRFLARFGTNFVEAGGSSRSPPNPPVRSFTKAGEHGNLKFNQSRLRRAVPMKRQTRRRATKRTRAASESGFLGWKNPRGSPFLPPPSGWRRAGQFLLLPGFKRMPCPIGTASMKVVPRKATFVLWKKDESFFVVWRQMLLAKAGER